MSFNDNHKARLLASFSRVNELLREAERILALREGEPPFSKHLPDATPVQRKIIGDYAARVRSIMQRFLQAHRIPLPLPSVSAVRAARIQLLTAQVTVEELAPRYLQGYGNLQEEARRDLDALVAELLELLGQMEGYLARESPQASLERLARQGEEGRCLAELGRIITEHGLVELRAALETLVNRFSSQELEVAFFGRINCGKSSLLNYILDTDFLPVGVTPVTGLPVRIAYGPKPQGTVRFADAATQVFDLGRLAEFASEQQNPSNARHVTRIQVELPSVLLKEGIAFVDTPGIASLASGEETTLAYLPRCDLGIVLVNGAAGLSWEDIRLVDALQRAGADILVLLSKADVLAPEERWKAASHVWGEISSRLGVEIAVHPVSVKEVDALLCDRWLEEVLLPRLRDCRRLARAKLQRKIDALRADAATALRRRLSRSGTRYPPEQRLKASQALAQARAYLAEARLQTRAPWNPPQIVQEILTEAAHNAAVLWHQSQETQSDLTALLIASMQSRAERMAAETFRDLEKLRASLSEALASACLTLEIATAAQDDLPSLRGAPVLDGSVCAIQTVLPKPRFASLGKRLLYHWLRRKWLGSPLRTTLAQALAHYGQQLEAWRLAMLDSLEQSFAAQAGSVRARLEEAPASGREAEASEAMERDLAWLASGRLGTQ